MDKKVQCLILGASSMWLLFVHGVALGYSMSKYPIIMELDWTFSVSLLIALGGILASVSLAD